MRSARDAPVPGQSRNSAPAASKTGRDVITILRDAYQAVEAVRAPGDTALNQQALDELRERYDTAVASGIIHNRRRDWDGGGGNHPGYALGTSLREYKDQVSCSPVISP